MRALYRAKPRGWKSAFDQLHPKLVRMMKERAREIIRVIGLVAVFAGLQILFDDSNKIGVPN